MTIRIVDKDGAERDWAWATAKYGAGLKLYPAQAGLAFWLVELREREDFSGCVVKVLDADGKPIDLQRVCQGWRDGPQIGVADLPTDGLPDALPPAGFAGTTNADGDCGFGWGQGEYYDPATQSGAHYYWVAGEETDVIDGIGMLYLTEHAHLEPTFQLVLDEEPEPPDPPEPPDDNVEKARQYIEEAQDLLDLALEALE